VSGYRYQDLTLSSRPWPFAINCFRKNKLRELRAEKKKAEVQVKAQVQVEVQLIPSYSICKYFYFRLSTLDFRLHVSCLLFFSTSRTSFQAQSRAVKSTSR